MADNFAVHDQRQQQLYEQLAAQPVVEVTGVVSASGMGGAKSTGPTPWTLLLSFDAWRIEGGPLRTEQLTIRRQVAEDVFRKLQEVMDAETVVRIRARVAEENVFGAPQALLEEFVQIDTGDTELHAYLEELQKPVTCQDDLLGTFTLDRSVNWYDGRALWNGAEVELHLSVEEANELEAALGVAHALWKDAAAWSQRVREYAVQQLLEMKNDAWLGEDEEELSPEEFQSRMTLESITIYPDGRFEFWHHDGDLFWGHSIQISGNLTEGPTDADIPG